MPNFIPYNPFNWYWIVGGDTSQAYSSARVQYVPADDSTYVAWAANNTPTAIASAADLYGVLVQQWVPSALSAGVTITSTGTPSLNDTYPLDPQSQQYITSISTGVAAGKGLPGGGSTFNFNGHSFTAANFLVFAQACEDYAYNVVQSLGQIVMTGSGSLPSSSVTIA